MTQKKFKNIGFLFSLSVFVLMLGIFLEYQLINWYERFYEAIQNKIVSEFYYSLGLFLMISIGIAIIQSSWGFISEILDMQLKSYLTIAGMTIGSRAKQNTAEINQKPIDDASLAAEKLSMVLPQIIAQTMKATLMIWLMLTISPKIVEFAALDISLPFPLITSAIAFLIVQLYLSKTFYPLMQRVDKFKRRSENNFRLKLIHSKIVTFKLLKTQTKRYIQSIQKIRKYSALKSLAIKLGLGIISSCSYIIPFAVLFSSYFSGQLNFGELMKLSAVFGFFQSAVSYIWGNVRELSRGVAAYKRVLGKI